VLDEKLGRAKYITFINARKNADMIAPEI